MSTFNIDSFPRPVITQPLDYEATYDLRIGDYITRMRAEGVAFDTETLETDPAVIAAESAAYGDMALIGRINDAGRAILLPSFASGSDLELQATRSGLGDDPRLEGETDDQLRERMRLSWKSKSAAGPDDYYLARARNTDLRVRDAALTAETRDFSDRVLIMSVLTNDKGGLLTDDLKDKLEEALNDPTFRSRNVTVEVVPAVITTVDVSATLWLYSDAPASVVDQAETALKNAATADQRLGFDLTESYVQRWLHQPGVQRVELTDWVDSFAAFNEALRLGTVTLAMQRVAS